MNGKRWLLMIGAFFFSVAVSYTLIQLRRAHASIPAAAPYDPLPPPDDPPPPAQSELKYTPAEGRSAEMQCFDKAILYLSAQQEADGHWSATKSGASSEFATVNGDIAITSLATAALLDACSFKQQNPDALARAKRGLDWMTARIRGDGGIADESAAGEPVTAQILAAMTFSQATDMSSRDTVRENAGRLCRYAANSMQAAPGGFGAAKGASAVRADLTALAVVMFNQARSSYIKFGTTPPSGNEKTDGQAEQETTRKIEQSIRKGLDSLQVKTGPNGGMALSSNHLESNWDGTVSGMLIEAALLIQDPKAQSALNFLLGTAFDPDKPDETKSFPGIEQHLDWGKNGEGFAALSVLQGSMMIYNIYGPNAPVWAAWIKATTGLLLKHQLSAGSWDAAGPDAARGCIWRTAINARVLPLIAPPQQMPPKQTP